MVDGDRAKEPLVISVDESVYSRGAVLRACYWLTDRCYVFIERPDESHLAITLTPKAGADVSREALAGEFSNSLIDFELRAELARETATIRELIVAKAFAEGDLLEDPPVGDDQDPVELSIGGPPPREHDGKR